MKKIACIAAVIVISVLGVIGCEKNSEEGSGHSLAYVDTERDGEVEMTKAELLNIYKENSVKFHTYVNCDIDLTARIESIDESMEYYSFNGEGRDCLTYIIKLSDGWQLELVADMHSEVIDLYVGDMVKVKSRINGVDGTNIILSDVGLSQQENKVYDFSEIEREY